MRHLRRFAILALLIMASFAVPRPGHAQVAISVTVAPPPLPVYAQPPIPGPGWIWAPGYWSWGPYGYYWVPGTWVWPPRVGLLWTPGWWGWDEGRYIWHAGYWAPHVGFYGGINYGFGYFGVGYVGGFWDHDRFHYDRAYNDIRGVHITDVYNRIAVVHNARRISFNGGRGGIVARPTAEDERFARERHFRPTALQERHAVAARGNHALRASFNHGHPAIAATPRPAAFTGRGVVRAQRAVPYRPSHGRQPRPEIHRASAAGPRRPAPAYHPQPQHGGHHTDSGPHTDIFGGAPSEGGGHGHHHP